jgi:hypothetical protein
MLNSSDGIEGVKNFVVDCVRQAGGRPCPPVIVGVGLGGNFEQAALLAKKALLRPLNVRHSDPTWAAVEDELLERINRLGIGPQGLGGVRRAGVSILDKPCHIASLPWRSIWIVIVTGMKLPFSNKIMSVIHHLVTPLNSAELTQLKIGDKVTLSGKIYTARDVAHQRLIKLLESGQPLPFKLEGGSSIMPGRRPLVPDVRLVPSGRRLPIVWIDLRLSYLTPA